MKATKMTLIAALAVGSMLTFSPALRADDATNSPSAARLAGGPPPGGMRGHGMRGRPNFDRLAKELNLTDDQKSKVQAIFEGRRGKMRELWQDHNLSRQDRRAKMRTMREETDAKLKAVLTAEQFKKFQELRSRMRGPRNGRHGGPPPMGNSTKVPSQE